MKLIIDRFEGEYAVCEMPNSKMVNIPKIILENAKEGSCVTVSVTEDNSLKEENEALLKKLFKK